MTMITTATRTRTGYPCLARYAILDGYATAGLVQLVPTSNLCHNHSLEALGQERVRKRLDKQNTEGRDGELSDLGHSRF